MPLDSDAASIAAEAERDAVAPERQSIDLPLVAGRILENLGAI